MNDCFLFQRNIPKALYFGDSHQVLQNYLFLPSFRLPFTSVPRVTYYISLFLLSCWNTLPESFLHLFWVIGGSSDFLGILSIYGKFAGNSLAVRPKSRIIGHTCSSVLVPHYCSNAPVVYSSLLKSASFTIWSWRVAKALTGVWGLTTEHAPPAQKKSQKCNVRVSFWRQKLRIGRI